MVVNYFTTQMVNRIGTVGLCCYLNIDPAKILSNSDNPFDLQYVNDYNNTRDLVTAHPERRCRLPINAFKAENKELGKMKPEDLMRESLYASIRIFTAMVSTRTAIRITIIRSYAITRKVSQQAALAKEAITMDSTS